MPEAAVHKNDGAVFRKDQVGPSADFRRMKAVAEAACVESPAQGHFWFRILLRDRPHDAGALLGNRGLARARCWLVSSRGIPRLTNHGDNSFTSRGGLRPSV